MQSAIILKVYSSVSIWVQFLCKSLVSVHLSEASEMCFWKISSSGSSLVRTRDISNGKCDATDIGLDKLSAYCSQRGTLLNTWFAEHVLTASVKETNHFNPLSVVGLCTENTCQCRQGWSGSACDIISDKMPTVCHGSCANGGECLNCSVNGVAIQCLNCRYLMLYLLVVSLALLCWTTVVHRLFYDVDDGIILIMYTLLVACQL